MFGEKLSLHIKDLVYGANDGIVSTFAVISGVVGAGLSSRIILIIGIASLLADGFSMASANYLGSRSEEAVYENERMIHKGVALSHVHPVKSALYTFCAFVAAGAVPLIPFVFGLSQQKFLLASVFTFLALFSVGAARTFVTERPFFLGGLEMVVVGGAAAAIAFFVGQFISALIS